MSRNGPVKRLPRVPNPVIPAADAPVRNWRNPTFSVVAGDVCFQEAATLIPTTDIGAKRTSTLGQAEVGFGSKLDQLSGLGSSVR
jgi:hypothetical protein